jgi:hypothetical protein
MRNYNFKDSKMIQLSGIYRQHYIDNAADFVARDPITFHPNYAADWQAAITAALQVQTHESRKDELRSETADVKQKMEEGRATYGTVMYFVERAFPNDPDKRALFGKDNYGSDSDSDYEMSMFLHQLYKTADKHAAALIAVGFSQTEIDAIEDLANDLYREDNEQEVHRRKDSEARVERVGIYVNCWNFSRNANALSKVIYRGNSVKLNLFIFPRGTEPVQTFNLLGKVTNALTGDPIEDVTLTLQEVGITVLSNDQGDYGFASVAPGTYTLRLMAAGYAPANLPVTILNNQVLTENVSLTPL